MLLAISALFVLQQPSFAYGSLHAGVIEFVGVEPGARHLVINRHLILGEYDCSGGTVLCLGFEHADIAVEFAVPRDLASHHVGETWNSSSFQYELSAELPHGAFENAYVIERVSEDGRPLRFQFVPDCGVVAFEVDGQQLGLAQDSDDHSRVFTFYMETCGFFAG